MTTIEAMRQLRFGVEIETNGLTYEWAARTVARAAGEGCEVYRYNPSSWACRMADGREWRCMPDASLSGGGTGRSAEVVSPILGYDDLDLLQRVVRALREAGAKVDASCGLHVHVSNENAVRFEARTLRNLARLIARNEDLITRALRVQPRRLERYCRPISPEFVRAIEHGGRTDESLRRAWYRHNGQGGPSRYDSSRYHGLNLNSAWYRNSVELRYFEGTLHAGEVKAYVQFALALCAKARESAGARARQRPYTEGTAKYDMRVFLQSNLGLRGEEFQTCRLHMIKHLPGSSSWATVRGVERRSRRREPAVHPCGDAAPATGDAFAPPRIDF